MRVSPVLIEIDGEPFTVAGGISVAAAMLAHGASTRVSLCGEPRSALCGMGLCGECRVELDGERDVLACMRTVHAGMRVRQLLPPDSGSLHE